MGQIFLIEKRAKNGHVAKGRKWVSLFLFFAYGRGRTHGRKADENTRVKLDKVPLGSTYLWTMPECGVLAYYLQIPDTSQFSEVSCDCYVDIMFAN